jgi:hypothetical protein
VTEVKRVRLPSGGLVSLEMISFSQARVVDVISTDPKDFLDRRWQPGTTVNVGQDTLF